MPAGGCSPRPSVVGGYDLSFVDAALKGRSDSRQEVTVDITAPDAQRVVAGSPACWYKCKLADQVFRKQWQQAPAHEGDSWEADFETEGGAYEVRMIGTGGTWHGILTVYIDGIWVAEIDQYRCQDTHPSEGIFTWVGDSPGSHTILVRVDGKHADSSNYDCCVQKIFFRPARDVTPEFEAAQRVLATAKKQEDDKRSMTRLEDKIARLMQEIEERRTERALVKSKFDERREDVEHEVEKEMHDGDALERELSLILNPPTNEPLPPGPACLRFVLTGPFDLLATFIIVSNITAMVMEVLDKSYEESFFWLDQSFMIFYVFELSCKGLLLQRGLLFGKISVVWWNWLDLIIVGTGVLDMWMQPLLIASGAMSGGGHSLKMFSFLRMLRLLRILKVVGMFLKADTTWAEDPPFQLFIMSVIGFNSVLMGFESDVPDFWMWFYVEQGLLVIFSFEIAVRLKRWGLHFFCHETDIGWNLLDFTIVSGGIVDMWLMPGIDIVKMMIGMRPSGKGSLGQIMMMLRMARLLRILRLVRLIKNIPPLFNLVVGIMQAMQGMMWVMVLTVLLLYTFALLGVKLISHGIVFGGTAPPAAENVFPTVAEGTFVLFKAMNGDWGAIEPLFGINIVFKIFFIVYMIVASWAILSILMAVVSENLLNATAEHDEEVEAEQKEKTEKRSEVQLNELFRRADKDGSKRLTHEEFQEMIKDPITSFELMEAANLGDGDKGRKVLTEMFQFLSWVDEGLNVKGSGDKDIDGTYQKDAQQKEAQTGEDDVPMYHHLKSGTTIFFQNGEWRLKLKSTGYLLDWEYSCPGTRNCKPLGEWTCKSNSAQKIFVKAQQIPEIQYKTFIEGLKNEKNPVHEKSVFRLEKRLKLLDKVMKVVEAKSGIKKKKAKPEARKKIKTAKTS